MGPKKNRCQINIFPTIMGLIIIIHYDYYYYIMSEKTLMYKNTKKLIDQTTWIKRLKNQINDRVRKITDIKKSY